MDVMPPFLLLFSVIEMLESSLQFLSFLFSYNMRIRGICFSPTSVSSLTASCLIVLFGILRISLHKTLWCCLFLSESKILV